MLAFACVSYPAAAAQQPSLGALARQAEAARRPAEPAQPAPAAGAPAAAPIVARWKSEQEWIVSDISSAITNIAASANGTRDGGPVTARAASGPGRGTTLAITDHIWDAAAYVPMARAALGPRQSTCSSLEPRLIGALLDPTPEILHRENRRISARLTEDMRCADAHEEAALLVGSFALREAAGIFNDTRRLISRMTAHLAVADALRPQAPAVTAAGDRPLRVLADAVQLTLIGRQKTALARLAALGPVPSDLDLQAWDRALRIRITYDWRLLQHPRRATLLEQLSWFRALQSRLGEATALRHYDSLQEPTPVVDWGRLVMQPWYGAGVEGGNRFADASIIREMDDAASVYASFFPQPLDGEALLEALNAEPQPGPAGPKGIFVLDWGTWAATAQRHLMMAVNAYDTHLLRLGLPDRAADFRTSLRKDLSKLRMFPLAATSLRGTPAEVRGALLDAAQLARTRPELLSDWMWKSLIMMEPSAPASATWFYPFFPAGTLFDVEHRPYAAHGRPRFTAAQIADFRTEAPYSRDLAEEAVKALGEKAPAAAIAAVYGEMPSYDSFFAGALANKFLDDPRKYGEAMERLIAIRLDSRADLAEYLVDRGLVADAVRHYERWLGETDNELDVANAVDWLVRRYYETGEQAKATALADRAAETYAYSGLILRANLHEWRGEPEDAARLLRAAGERYAKSSMGHTDLLAFYLRHKRSGHDTDALLAEIFPGGMKRVTVADLKGRPAAGALVKYTGEIGKANGLSVDDVIVAVDGVAVGNMRQYRVARNISHEPLMRVTVWRAGRYLEVATRLRFDWVYGRISDYKPASTAEPVAPAAAAAGTGGTR